MNAPVVVSKIAIRRLRKLSASLDRLCSREKIVLANLQSEINQLDAEKEAVLRFLSSCTIQGLLQELGLKRLGGIAERADTVRVHVTEAQRQISRKEKTIEIIEQRLQRLMRAADRKELESTLSDWLGANVLQGRDKDHLS